MGVSTIRDAVDSEDGFERVGEVDYPEILTAAILIAKPPKSIKWLIEGVIPQGKVGILAAQGGTGKSMFALQLGAAIATDLPPYEGMWEIGLNASGAVLYLAGEEAKDDLHRRMWSIAQWMNDDKKPNTQGEVLSLPKPKLVKRLKQFKLIPLAGVPTHFLDDNDETEFYEETLAVAIGIQNLKLIIIDPLRRYYNGEENDSGATTNIMCLCERLAENTGATVLILHHVAKSAGNSKDSFDQNMIRGSSAITDSARFQINLKTLDQKELDKVGISSEERGRYISVALTKSNYGPPQSELLYLRRGEGGFLSQYKPDQFVGDTEDLEEAIYRLVTADEEAGQRRGKTDFKRHYASRQLEVGQKAIGNKIDSMVERGRLFYIPNTTPKGPGRPADLLSTTPSPTRRRHRNKAD